MSSSERFPWSLGPGEPRCGADGCEKGMRFNAMGDLEHVDGTDLCLADSELTMDDVERISPQVAVKGVPAWARLEAQHRMRIEAWEERREPSGWAVILLTVFVLLLAFGCIGYSLLGMSALGLDFPWS